MRTMMAVIVLLLMLSPEPTYAHDIFGITALSGGLLHPLLGPDHLLAMLAVGVISSKIGGKAIWMVPIMFVTALILGSIMGMMNIIFPFLESGIAFSVLILGVGIIVRGERNHSVFTLLVVAVFGLYHGNAHGSEFLSGQMPGMYTFGFVISTIGLHIMGLFIGSIFQQHQRASKRFIICGLLVALCGMIFLADTITRLYVHAHY